MDLDAIKARYAEEDLWICAAHAREDIPALVAEVERLRARYTAPIVVLCGSVRFRSTWSEEYGRLTDEGHIVLSVGRMLPKEAGSFDPLHKERLDALHKRKIDLADWVWVLDVGGYIGDSTKSEIAYAQSIGRPVRYLSREYPDYAQPQEEEALASVVAEVERLRATFAACVRDGQRLAKHLDDAERENERLHAIFDAAAQRASALEEALRCIQWGDLEDGTPRCPYCGNMESKDHMTGCRIGTALRAPEGAG